MLSGYNMCCVVQVEMHSNTPQAFIVVSCVSPRVSFAFEVEYWRMQILNLLLYSRCALLELVFCVATRTASWGGLC